RLAAAAAVASTTRIKKPTSSRHLTVGPSEEQRTGTAPSSVETHTSWDTCAVRQPLKRALRGAEDRHRA
ncbi:hypothetical protein O3P69_016304, partial [Scylla paramamosain]